MKVWNRHLRIAPYVHNETVAGFTDALDVSNLLGQQNHFVNDSRVVARDVIGAGVVHLGHDQYVYGGLWRNVVKGVGDVRLGNL